MQAAPRKLEAALRLLPLLSVRLHTVAAKRLAVLHMLLSEAALRLFTAAQSVRLHTVAAKVLAVLHMAALSMAAAAHGRALHGLTVRLQADGVKPPCAGVMPPCSCGGKLPLVATSVVFFAALLSRCDGDNLARSIQAGSHQT